MGFVSRLALAIQARLRRKRLELFWALVQPAADDLVLDLGGGAGFFAEHYPHKEMVVAVDISCHFAQFARSFGVRRFVVASGTALPFRSSSVDVVYCNSVIEHVEGQEEFAAEIRRVTRRVYFVQTPNKHFPVEPHFLLPFIAYVPYPVGKWVFERLRFVRWSPDQVFERIHYVSAHRLRELFPGSAVFRERVLGVVKSFVAVGPNRAEAVPRFPDP